MPQMRFCRYLPLALHDAGFMLLTSRVLIILALEEGEYERYSGSYNRDNGGEGFSVSRSLCQYVQLHPVRISGRIHLGLSDRLLPAGAISCLIPCYEFTD